MDAVRSIGIKAVHLRDLKTVQAAETIIIMQR
jgi:hypothetical protein